MVGYRASAPIAEKGLEMPRIPVRPLGIGAVGRLVCGMVCVAGPFQVNAERAKQELELAIPDRTRGCR